jgi:hypothetical protein
MSFFSIRQSQLQFILLLSCHQLTPVGKKSRQPANSWVVGKADKYNPPLVGLTLSTIVYPAILQSANTSLGIVFQNLWQSLSPCFRRTLSLRSYPPQISRCALNTLPKTSILHRLDCLSTIFYPAVLQSASTPSCIIFRSIFDNRSHHSPRRTLSLRSNHPKFWGAGWISYRRSLFLSKLKLRYHC